ncbi:DoxX family protein [Chitinophaga sp. GCM10012297]|uniref:DoxX family membrane protein n=1 Tax=Chitinophaga chungangae TaxID=2821488 RepID=A0ABS3YAE2_9BACT|nr:DoxX family membrane protein [Chitinophaga chungangae]MBO9151621.1 DoxX family membrane protein [Chitinophaga chungangae]
MYSNNTKGYEQLFLRMALGASLLSAVADRFGLLWGEKASWGNWENFAAYSAQLTFYLPSSLHNAAAVIATTLEILFAVMLVTGFKTRLAALSTGVLLLVFALSMTFALGAQSALGYSVWIGSAAAFLLAKQGSYPFSVDQALER